MPTALFQEIKDIWVNAKSQAYTIVNRALIDAYWHIGRRIVQEEQGTKRADYGRFLLRDLAARLTSELDKHLDERELRRCRQFYSLFPIRDALRPELTWTHYRLLIRIENASARQYYLHEAASHGWGTRQLERNIQSGYYERLILHREVVPGATGTPLTPLDLVKDPYVLEFLQVDIPHCYSENDLEKAILAKLHDFLLEMGKGFAFVGRQYQLKTDTKSYFIDLVFYNFLLKCFVLIDLKVQELSHQDIGQMDMYVRMFENLRKIKGDNPTIGIILCAEKDATLVKYSVLEESTQLFASTYRLVLPTEKELSRAVEQQKELFHRMQDSKL